MCVGGEEEEEEEREKEEEEEESTMSFFRVAYRTWALYPVNYTTEKNVFSFPINN